MIFPSLSPIDDHKQKWVKLPFLGNISYKLKNLLPKELNTAFYNPSNLQRVLSHPKDKRDTCTLSGVYKLSCQDCPMSYVGQSGRPISTRGMEHQRCYRLKKTDSSAFAAHLITENHRSTFSAELLHRLNKGKKMDAMETIEITCTPNLTNEITFSNPSPLLTLPSKLSLI